MEADANEQLCPVKVVTRQRQHSENPDFRNMQTQFLFTGFLSLIFRLAQTVLLSNVQFEIRSGLTLEQRKWRLWLWYLAGIVYTAVDDDASPAEVLFGRRQKSLIYSNAV